MIKRRRAKFMRSEIGSCVYLDHSIFKNDEIKIEKTLEVLDLFSTKDLIVKSNWFNEEDDIFIKEMEKTIDYTIESFTKTRWLSKKTYNMIQITFEGSDIRRVIELVIERDIALEADCYDKDGLISLKMAINDIDGSCISFNTEKFNEKEIKTKIDRIFEQNQRHKS